MDTKCRLYRYYRRREGLRVLQSFHNTISSPKLMISLVLVSTAIIALYRIRRSKSKDNVESQTVLDKIPPHPMDSQTHYVDQMGLDHDKVGVVSQGRVVRNDEDIKKSIVVHVDYTANSCFGGGRGTAMGVTLEPGVVILNNHTWQQIDKDKAVTLSWSKTFRVNQTESSSMDPMPSRSVISYPNSWVVEPIDGTEMMMISVLESHVPTNLSLLTDDTYKERDTFYMWSRNDLCTIETRVVKNTFHMTGDEFCKQMKFASQDSKIPIPKIDKIVGGEVDGGRGTSGSPILSVRPTANGDQHRLRLLGIHCWGSVPREGATRFGYSCPLPKSLYNSTRAKLMSKVGRCSVVANHTLIVPDRPMLGCDDSTICENGVINSGFGPLGGVHPRSAVNFQTSGFKEAGGFEPDIGGYLHVVGSFSQGDSGHFSTHYRITPFDDEVKAFAKSVFGDSAVPNKVPPDIRRYNYYDRDGSLITPSKQRSRMSHVFLDDAASSNKQIDRNIMDAAANSYLDLLVRQIEQDDDVRSAIAVYSTDIALNGDSGRRGMSGMNMSTSSGFNGIGKRQKKRDLFQRDSQADRYVLSTQQQSYIDLLESKVRRGEVLGLPFLVCYKDEPVKSSKIERHEIRAFAIISWATSLLLRKYGLWIQRIMQIAPHVFGTAVGLNCTSDQWEALFNYLSNDQEFKYFLDADYKKFDKKAISRFTTEYVRSIFLHLASLSDNFDEEDKTALNALLYDVMNPWIIERMTVFQVLGMNSSGNNLTININTVANNLLVRYAFLSYKYKPRIQPNWFSVGFTGSFPSLHELCVAFERETRIVTLGDDVIIARKTMGKDDFTNRVLIDSLGKIGIEVTAPDKGDSTPLDFKTGFPVHSGDDLGGVVPVEIAQRIFRKLDGFKYLTAPLNWKSILKSLTVVNSAADCDPADLWGARLRMILTEAVFHGPTEHLKVWKFCRSLDFSKVSLDNDLVWIRSLLHRGNPSLDPKVHFDQVREKFNDLGEMETIDLTDDDSDLFLSRGSSVELQFESRIWDCFYPDYEYADYCATIFNVGLP